MGIESDTGTLVRGEWRPTRAQFDAYKAREIELCVKQMRSGRVSRAASLFDVTTIDAAEKELGIVKDANGFAVGESFTHHVRGAKAGVARVTGILKNKITVSQ